MKFFEHPIILSVVFFFSAFGALFSLGIIVYELLQGREFFVPAAVLGTCWLWGACSSGKRLFGFTPNAIRADVEAFTSILEGLPYPEAIASARIDCVQIPRELVLRKVSPAAAEWCGFEKNGVRFLIEKNEASGLAIVSFYK